MRLPICKVAHRDCVIINYIGGIVAKGLIVPCTCYAVCELNQIPPLEITACMALLEEFKANKEIGIVNVIQVDHTIDAWLEVSVCLEPNACMVTALHYRIDWKGGFARVYAYCKNDKVANQIKKDLQCIEKHYYNNYNL